VTVRDTAGRGAVVDAARLGWAAPNVADVFAEPGSGDGVGLSPNLAVSSVSVRAVGGGVGDRGRDTGGGVWIADAVGVAARGGGAGAGSWSAASGETVGDRAAGDEVSGGAGVGERLRVSELVRARVAAGVLVPLSWAALLAYALGEPDRVRDANGEVVVRTSDGGVVGLRPAVGSPSRSAPDALWKAAVSIASGGWVPTPRAGGGGDASRPGRRGGVVGCDSRGSGPEVRARVTVRAAPARVAVRAASGSVAVRARTMHALHDTSE
jgi:hypothetical protein